MTTFTLTETQPHSRALLDSRGFVYQSNRSLDARWVFDDGVIVTVHERRDLTWHYSRGRPQRTHEVELTKLPRVYVDVEENLLENLCGRQSRPHVAWKPRVAEALARIGVVGPLAWSQRAGCSCPCSPGFIIKGWTGPRFDAWVTLPGAPVVIEDELYAARAAAFGVTR